MSLTMVWGFLLKIYLIFLTFTSSPQTHLHKEEAELDYTWFSNLFKCTEEKWV